MGIWRTRRMYLTWNRNRSQKTEEKVSTLDNEILSDIYKVKIHALSDSAFCVASSAMTGSANKGTNMLRTCFFYVEWMEIELFVLPSAITMHIYREVQQLFSEASASGNRCSPKTYSH